MQTKSSRSTSSLVMTAMMMCIIIVSIFLLRVPVPFTQGYVNLSDGIIFIAVILLGRKEGAVAAAFGSMLGDVIGGFAMWAPWSFFIKGGMALIVGLVIAAFAKKDLCGKKMVVVKIIAMICGGLFMVGGYFVAEGIMYGNWAVALLGVPWNICQFLVGIILALCVTGALQKTSLFKEGKL